MENKKLTTEELNSVRKLQEDYAAITNQLGSLELTKIQIEDRKQALLSSLKATQEEERKISAELSEKYGDGQIDMDKGEFISREEEK